MDVTNNSPGGALVPCIPHAHPSMTLCCHPNVVDDRAPPHNHCIPHQFFLQGISWLLLLFDVVGRRQRSHILLHSSRQKFTNFCFTLDFLFYFIWFHPNRFHCHAKTLTSPPVLLYTCLEFLEATALTTDDPCYPTHHIARFLTVHTLFFDRFFRFPTPLSYGSPLSCQ